MQTEEGEMQKVQKRKEQEFANIKIKLLTFLKNVNITNIRKISEINWEIAEKILFLCKM